MLRAPRSSESAESLARVGHRDLRQCLIDSACNHCTGRADLPRPTDELATIEIRPGQREEQLARLERAGVRTDAGKPRVGSVQLTLHGICGA